MKARVKATGEIVKVAYLSEDKYGNKYYNVTTDTRTYRETELEMISDKGDYFYTYDYWEKLKHQFAGMAMQAYITRHDDDRFYIDDLANDAVNFASALVEKLKSESNG